MGPPQHTFHIIAPSPLPIESVGGGPARERSYLVDDFILCGDRVRPCEVGPAAQLAPDSEETTDVRQVLASCEFALAPNRRGRRLWVLESLEERTLLSVSPTLYTVTDVSDSATDTGSLRYAITQANANSNPAGSLIQFDTAAFSSPQTITLASTLELSESAGPEVIDGPGSAVLTISGNNAVRVFTVDTNVEAKLVGLTISDGHVTTPANGGGISNSGGTLTIDACTISGNNAAGYGDPNGGGGIYNTGTLTVTGSTISGNQAASFGGGIDNLGKLEVTDSTISGNQLSDPFRSTAGGGIYNIGGDASVVSCTIANNDATYGGGIDNGVSHTLTSTLAVISSVIEGNTAEFTGGGIINGYDGSGSLSVVVSTCTFEDNHALGFEGGGIYNANTLTVNSCTFVGNSADRGGGISSPGGTLAVTSSTITGNTTANGWRGEGGGIYTGGSATVVSSTIADNSAVNGGGIFWSAGTIVLNNTIVATNLVSVRAGHSG